MPPPMPPCLGVREPAGPCPTARCPFPPASIRYLLEAAHRGGSDGGRVRRPAWRALRRRLCRLRRSPRRCQSISAMTHLRHLLHRCSPTQPPPYHPTVPLPSSHLSNLCPNFDGRLHPCHHLLPPLPGSSAASSHPVFTPRLHRSRLVFVWRTCCAQRHPPTSALTPTAGSFPLPHPGTRMQSARAEAAIVSCSR